MDPQDQLRSFFMARKSPVFSATYLENLHRLDIGCCLPGSIKVETLIIPAIAIHVDPSGLKYFGIDKGPAKDMDHRFRYLDNYDGDEMVQICLHMKQNRQLALNLDPVSELTRRYLAGIIKAGLLGFIFFCRSKRHFMTSYTSPHKEESDWLDRNLKRTLRLRSNDFHRIMMGAMFHDKATGVAEKK